MGRVMSPSELSPVGGAPTPFGLGRTAEGSAPRVSTRSHSEMSDLKLVKFDPARVAVFLRRLHPAKTAERVADDTGVPAETVRQWLKGAATPGFGRLFALIDAYGPEFLVAVFPRAPRWLDAAWRAEEQRDLEDQMTAMRARCADLTRPSLTRPSDDEKGMAAAAGGRAGDDRAVAHPAAAGGHRALARVHRAAGSGG